jgi:long-chain acyl-CoA synthetase
MPHDPATLHSLPRYLLSLAALGERTALIEQHLYRASRISYAELIGKASAFHRELERRGIGRGDRVMLWGAAGIGWAAAFYGCVLAGAVVVPLDAAFSSELAAKVLGQTQAALLCTDHEDAPGAARMSFAEIVGLAPAPAPLAVEVPPETLLEIVYTSGATADPKGVMITHGNVLANLRPIAKEVAKYKPRMRLVLPIRFVHLIPLSHLFGQVMGLLIPPLVDSTVVFPESQAPAQWAAIIREHRASALVAVPQQLQLFTQWAETETGISREQAPSLSRGHGVLWRFWHWRKLHRRLGWRMWAFIVGGAALAPALDEYWHALGYAMVQGYGLTETAPAIAITHPFKIKRGTVGQTLEGLEVKIAPDGEILVRGANVSPGYYRNPEATGQTFSDGWLHTGDLGRMEPNKMLVFLGRKKEVIVTPEGLNVFPDDVERALALQPRVQESAAVEDRRGGGGQVHAVVVLKPGAGPEALDEAVAAANAHLEPHQRIRAASLWPGPQLPRTASTRKLQRMAIAGWVNQGQPAAATGGNDGAGGWKGFAAQRWGIAAGRLRPEARLDHDLGLSSLDRVELWSWIEAHTAGGIDETSLSVAQTVADVDALLQPAYAAGATANRSMAPPTTRAGEGKLAGAELRVPAQQKMWPLQPAFRHFRSAAYSAIVFPVLHTAVWSLRIEGREHFQGAPRPLILIANHQSMLDVPLILRGMPRAWRPWVAPAMGIEPFAGAFNARAGAWRRWRDGGRLRGVRLFFNGYLLTTYGAVGASLRHTGRLADAGYCPLIFPEGARTPDGRMHAFRPGIGVFVAALRLPVMPIRIDGLFQILPDGALYPHPGGASVRFGPVMNFPTEPAETITALLESWFTIS